MPGCRLQAGSGFAGRRLHAGVPHSSSMRFCVWGHDWSGPAMRSGCRSGERQAQSQEPAQAPRIWKRGPQGSLLVESLHSTRTPRRPLGKLWRSQTRSPLIVVTVGKQTKAGLNSGFRIIITQTTKQTIQFRPYATSSYLIPTRHTALEVCCKRGLPRSPTAAATRPYLCQRSLVLFTIQGLGAYLREANPDE